MLFLSYNADLQNNLDTRMCRFIAHIADLSACGGFHDIPDILINH